MTGAMYAAIGGLRSHMNKLNVIGNNIANVNTFGYKSQRMTFRESIYGTNRSGSNGGEVSGGNNPSQTGYGCMVGTIDLNMSPSTYSPTGVNMDCYIDGDGFFMVGDKLQCEETYDETTGAITKAEWTGGVTGGNQLKDFDLTRVGDFFVDPDGYICNGDNKIIYGFARVQNPNYVRGATKQQIQQAKNNGIDIESETIISTHLVPLRVPLQAAKPTEQTGAGTADDPFVGNGGKVVKDKLDEQGNPIPDPDNPGENLKETIYLWEEGDPVYPFLAENGLNQYAHPDLFQTKQATLDANAGGGGGGAGGTTDLVDDTLGVSQIAVAENTAEDAVSNVMPCQLRNMGIGTDGSIYGTANGKTVVIGYVALASADNPNGVTHTGGPYYKCMPGAGNLRVSTLGLELPTGYLANKKDPDGEGGVGGLNTDNAAAIDKIWLEKSTSLQSQGLEASGTDLAYEFAEMVTTQRGYQANTRIVSVTDSMLEELVNMKR